MKDTLLKFLQKNQVAIACLLLCQCGCGRDTAEIADQKIAERVEDFRAKKIAECREALFQTAEKMVDSILLSEAQDALRDSLTRSRPFRPFQPSAILPIDSLSVKPLFEGGKPASGTRQ